MKKLHLFLEICGLLMLVIGEAHASQTSTISVSGATGSGTVNDPYMLSLNTPITITDHVVVTPGQKTFANDFYFDFNSSNASEYLNYVGMSSNPQNVNYGLGNGYPYAQVFYTNDSKQIVEGIAELSDAIVLDGVVTHTGSYLFYNNGPTDPSVLPTTPDPYVLRIKGSTKDDNGQYLNTDFTYSFSFQVGVLQSPVSAIPLPGSAWLALSGILGWLGMSKSAGNKSAVAHAKQCLV